MLCLITIWLLVAQAILVPASQKAFSVNDDLFAYPQYEISISPGFISDQHAADLLQQSTTGGQGPLEESDQSNLTTHHRALLDNRPFLCTIPLVVNAPNATKETRSEEDEQKELIRAADRGWELLKDMEGKQCLFYTAGWWSYTFCYKSYVKQFHSLQPGTGGQRAWPPQEDPSTPSYVLGRFDAKAEKQSQAGPTTKDAALQKKAESSYLMQKMKGGTPCDLIGKERTIEVQFHCHPQSTDRIGWIKETSTCSYLMVVYTARLCNDVAFQLPKDSVAHTISCQAITSEAQVSSIGTLTNNQDVENNEDRPIMIGDVELGAMKLVGKDGKKIERGRVVMTAEEKAEVVMMQKDGQIQGLSRTELKKLNLDPEMVKELQSQLQKIAGRKDWKIERLDGNGQIHLRGIVAEDDEENSKQGEEELDAGSEEEYKQPD